MRHVYALLALSLIVVFVGTYLLTNEAEAPTAPAAETNNIESQTMAMKLTSSVFSDGEMIPSKYTCDGDNVNPPLSISGVPEGVESLVLVMDDSDIPNEIKEKMGIEKFNHWSVYNLPSDTTEIGEGDVAGIAGLHTRGEAAYTGPCPPTEYEPTTHRYIFRLYALAGQLNFITAPTLDEIETATQGMMLEKAELTGLYSRVTEE